MIGMYSIAAVGLVYAWFRPPLGWDFGLGPATIGPVIGIVVYTFAFVSILANRLPRKYAKPSNTNQSDPQQKAKP